jgi:hypothetical protein
MLYSPDCVARPGSIPTKNMTCVHQLYLFYGTVICLKSAYTDLPPAVLVVAAPFPAIRQSWMLRAGPVHFGYVDSRGHQSMRSYSLLVLLEQAGINRATDQPHLDSTIPSFLSHQVCSCDHPYDQPLYLSNILSL